MNSKTSIALTKIASHHKEWITTCKALYGNNIEVDNYAEDYIQEVYIKLAKIKDLHSKVIKPDGKVSKGYVFFCLRSVVLNDLTKKKKVRYSHLGDQYDLEEKYMLVDTDRDLTDAARDEIEELMYKVAQEGSHWFDYKLFETYLRTGKSYRILAAETGLGIQTVYLSIKKTKLLIAEKLFDKYNTIK